MKSPCFLGDDKADSERVDKKVINKNVTAYWLRLIRRNIHTKLKLMNSKFLNSLTDYQFSTITFTASHPGKNNMSKKSQNSKYNVATAPRQFKKAKTSQIYHFGRTRMGMLRHRPLPLGLVTKDGARISGSWGSS